MIVKNYKDPKLGVHFWRFDAWVDGRRLRRKGFSTKEAATKALAKARTTSTERRAGIIHDAPVKVTVAEVIKKRISLIRVPKGARGYYSHNQAVVDLQRFLGMLPDGMLVTELRTAHFADYRDERLKAVQPQTVYRELTNLHACFNQAFEKFPELETWKPPKRPSLEVPDGARQVTFTPSEVQKVLLYLRRPRETAHGRYHRGEPFRSYRARMDAADYFQMALQTSKRAGEIRTRAWSDVLWHKNALRVDTTKTNTEGVIYLPDSLIALLKERQARQQPKSKWLFPSDLHPEKPIGRLNVEIIRRACAHLEIEWGYNSPRGVVFHTTRHTAITAMVDEGFDMKIVQAQTGHSDSTMVRRYNHPKQSLHREAVKALDRFSEVSILVPASTPTQPDMPPKPRVRDKQKASKKRGKGKK
jgi:integrase